MKMNEPIVSRPGELTPALAGALVHNDLGARLALATLAAWDDADRVKIEAAGANGLVLRLVATDPPATAFEDALWRRLRAATDAGGGLTQVELREVMRGWPELAGTLRDELIGRGWYLAEEDNRRRRLAFAAGGGFALSIGCLAASLAGGPAGLLLLGALLAVVAVGLLLVRSRLSPLTAAGRVEARAWRQYRAELRRSVAAAGSPDDVAWAIPDLIAFGDQALIDRLAGQRRPETDPARLLELERLRTADHLVATSILLFAALPLDGGLDGGARGFSGLDAGAFGGGSDVGSGGGDGGSY